MTKITNHVGRFWQLWLDALKVQERQAFDAPWRRSCTN